MKIAIVNQSSSITALEFHCMVAAAKAQIQNEFANAWGTERGPADIKIFADASSVPDGYWVMTIVDDINAGYFGYHVNTTPVSQGFLFADVIIGYGCPVLHDPGDPTFFTVSSMLCHELLELIVDPCVNEWWDGPGITLENGFTPIASYASEVCDPVYFDVYQKTISGDIGDGYYLNDPVIVNVSNFIYPAWKDYYADPSEQFDQMSILTGPFSMDSGGYMLVRSADYMTEQYVYGANFPNQFMPFVKTHARTANRTSNVPRSLFRPNNGVSRNMPKPFKVKLK
ncbi:MAG TPA: hypothetical protein VM577_07215 [Anaerovoracaceae bacterium]|nr:hypothetical protein [Anaerovoracaceae bacterium]